jgi:hypothetical protein
MSASIQKQAVRLLNPFRGVMNIIEYEGAEAVTIDGINWDIYVRDISLTRDLDESRDILITEIRFGHWSPGTGLRRGPIYPSDDFELMEQQGNRVYQYLLDHHLEIPFALSDHYELWLLDQDDQPLALLGSSYDPERLHYDQPLSWTSGNACRVHFTERGSAKAAGGISTAQCLEDYVRCFAGERPRAQWFRRDTRHAQGLSGINLPQALEQRQLGNGCFPEYFVRDASDSLDHAVDFPLYLKFLSPYLLTLPDLTQEQRRFYEKAARRHALSVDRLYRLYPEICERKHIDAARIEARLRNRQPAGNDDETSMSPEYIELNISRTN